MDLLSTLLLFAVAGFLLKSGEQRKRIALLASHLGPHQIEKLMERLNESYQRALGESDPERRAQIWPLHEATERELARQFLRFAESFGEVDAASTWVNANLLPYAHRWLPTALSPGFDARELMRVHARGIERTVNNADGLAPGERARTLLAELYLMQHSCHWFCRTRSLASARILARHQTTCRQALAAVSPTTRQAYATVTGNRTPDR